MGEDEMPKVSLRTALALSFTICAVVPASAEYRNIGPGPTLDYSLAYCDNASMGIGGGQVVVGSPSFVLGASIGAAIRRSIDQSRFKENCMVMNGWKWFPNQTETVRQKRNYNNRQCLGASCD
jgi:hypothetical protein